MKPASADLIQLLNGRNTAAMADLYTLTMRTGTVLHWTSADRDVTVGGTTWTAPTEAGTQPTIKRGGIRVAKGLEVDTLDVTLETGDTARIAGVRVPLFAHNGGFDGARVMIQRAFMDDWATAPAGALVLFEGAVAGVDPASWRTVLHVKSELERFQVEIPHVLFMPGCANAFGDTGCGMNLEALTETHTVATGSDMAHLVATLGHADGYFTLGVLEMQTGATTGARRAIRAHASGALILSTALPADPAPGDTFTIYPGCARTKAACEAWGNAGRFRGCPFVPPPESTR